jgi:hypothetical protein
LLRKLVAGELEEKVCPQGFAQLEPGVGCKTSGLEENWDSCKLAYQDCLAMLICVQCLAMNPFPRGDDWMSWSAETRLAYVAAYVQAYGEGFRVGCFAGQEAYATKIPKWDAGERCVGRGKTFSNPEEDYVDKITAYYRSYPADRHVLVGKVLEGLCDERQLTPQQMHEYYGPKR